MERSDSGTSTPKVTRRTTLRAAAAVGASAVWVLPVIQGVSMASAHAASGTPNPRGGDDDQGEDNNDQGGGGKKKH